MELLGGVVVDGLLEPALVRGVGSELSEVWCPWVTADTWEQIIGLRFRSKVTTQSHLGVAATGHLFILGSGLQVTPESHLG